jgi:zinc protease
MNYLSSWISYEVRELNALSYAAYVEVLDRGAPGAVIFISTTRPDSATRLVNRILLRYEREITIPRYALRKAAERFNTMYIYGTESASRHAEMLARAQLYEGDFRAAARQAEIMKKLGFPDLRSAVKTYAKNIQYVYVGDTTRVKPAEFTKR